MCVLGGYVYAGRNRVLIVDQKNFVYCKDHGHDMVRILKILIFFFFFLKMHLVLVYTAHNEMYLLANLCFGKTVGKKRTRPNCEISSG